MNKLLDKKVAVVTGAGRGIGAAIAQLFAAEGANVAVCSLSLANAQKVAAEVALLGVKALPYAVNTADSEQVNSCEMNKLPDELRTLYNPERNSKILVKVIE